MQKVDIICFICRNRVGYIYPEECSVPLRGDMIHRHRGTEHWPLPLAMHGPLDFVCPHAGEDQHLFIPIKEADHESAHEFMDAGHKLFSVDNTIVGECPCGCGNPVRQGNKYANALVCYRRHEAKLKAETQNDGSR